MVIRRSSTSHLLSRMANSSWSRWRRARKHATSLVCLCVACLCVCVCVAWITVHTACVDPAGTTSHMTDCLGVRRSGLAGCWDTGLNDQSTVGHTFIFFCHSYLYEWDCLAFVSKLCRHVANSESASVFTALVWLDLFSAGTCFIKEDAKPALDGQRK